ncbi:hypothetical protein GcC1_146006 [Golovinomyces cichoracearum]|uniref:Uncharacterized protein n=1 Tax=Golovinomyces cichoracearum TaxID=62708 RepID=A0A420HYX3_9PEZI|nr:hypothetical protein GcC1_146006 [Golovinomyces cichoracearum]
MSTAASLFRWLQRKRYQYEVTFSLYMLTPTEKFIFSKLQIFNIFLPFSSTSRQLVPPKILLDGAFVRI